MRMSALVTIIAGALAATPPHAHAAPPASVPESERDAGFLMKPGERVQLRLDDQLRVMNVKALAATTQSAAPAQKGLSAETLTPLETTPFTAAEDTLVVTLWSDEQDGTRLQVENGYGRDLIYVAALLVGDQRQISSFHLTTICAIAPGKIGFETWPERVDGVLVVRWLEPPASSKTQCIDPTEAPDDPKFYTLE